MVVAVDMQLVDKLTSDDVVIGSEPELGFRILRQETENLKLEDEMVPEILKVAS